MNNLYLHVHGQKSWHQEAIIVGNEQALLALKKAIEEAIATGRGSATFFAGVLKKATMDFANLTVPYTVQYGE